MSKIIVSATTSYVAEAAVMSLLNGGFLAETARINYNLKRGLPPIEEFEKYPLILEGKLAGSRTSIYVYSVSAGYGGSGPHALVDILKVADFRFDKNDILTNRIANYDNQVTLKLER